MPAGLSICLALIRKSLLSTEHNHQHHHQERATRRIKSIDRPISSFKWPNREGQRANSPPPSLAECLPVTCRLDSFVSFRPYLCPNTGSSTGAERRLNLRVAFCVLHVAYDSRNARRSAPESVGRSTPWSTVGSEFTSTEIRERFLENCMLDQNRVICVQEAISDFGFVSFSTNSGKPVAKYFLSPRQR